jgi:hypothetical protein
MAGLVCSAIVGFLCLQVPIGDTADIKLTDQGLYIADTIQVKDWTLSWGRSMEWAPPQLDGSKLAKACDDSTCVVYWRKCNDAAQPTKCSYAVALAGDSSVFFDLTASGADAMKQAMDAIRIVVDLKPGATVPLSKLDREGPGDQAPVLPTGNAPL